MSAPGASRVACANWPGNEGTFGPSSARCLGGATWRRHYSHNTPRRFHWRGERQAGGKRAALAFFTLDRDGASVELHEPTRTREPQAGSREAPDYVRAAMKSVEDMGKVVARDTHTFVTYDEQSRLAAGSIGCLY